MSLYKHRYTTKSGTVESTDWYYRFNRDGKTYTGSTGSSNKTQAAKIEDKKKQEVNDKRLNGDIKRLAIKQALAKYLEAMAKSGEIRNIKSRVSKLLGFTTDKRTMKPTPVYGFDHDRMFDTLTNADVQQLVMERRNHGISNGTVLTELSTLNQTIRLVKRLGFQVPDVDFAEIKKDNAVRPAKGKLRYLTADEEECLLLQLHPDTVCRGSGSEVVYAQRQDAHDLAVLLLDIGGRYSEIAKLEWKQIDLANGTVHIWRSKVKNESVLGLSDRALAVLTRRSTNKHKEQRFIFEAKDGTARKYSPRAFNSAFVRAGIEGATIHTIRHTFSSKLVQNGVSLQELQQLLGHTSSTTTAIYAHLAPNQASARAVGILNKL